MKNKCALCSGYTIGCVDTSKVKNSIVYLFTCQSCWDRYTINDLTVLDFEKNITLLTQYSIKH